MYDHQRALHHLDVTAGAWIYRVFFLASTLQGRSLDREQTAGQARHKPAPGCDHERYLACIPLAIGSFSQYSFERALHIAIPSRLYPLPTVEEHAVVHYPFQIGAETWAPEEDQDTFVL